MNRWFFTAGVLLLFALVAIVGRAWSYGQPPPAPRTRVAVVNLAHVLKNYDKCKKLQDDMHSKITPLETRARELQAEIERLKQALGALALPPGKREDMERQLREMQRAREDVQVEANALVRRQQDKMTVELYQDVRQAAERYARAHGIDLVLQYSDASPDNPAELNQPSNVTRKMQQVACLPLYAASGLDITREVTAALNGSQRRPGSSR